MKKYTFIILIILSLFTILLFPPGKQSRAYVGGKECKPVDQDILSKEAVTVYEITKYILEAYRLKMAQEAQLCEFIPGEIIISVTPGIVSLEENRFTFYSQTISSLNSKFGLQQIEKVTAWNNKINSETYILKFSENIDVSEVAYAYLSDPDILHAEPNYVAQIDF